MDSFITIDLSKVIWSNKSSYLSRQAGQKWESTPGNRLGGKHAIHWATLRSRSCRPGHLGSSGDDQGKYSVSPLRVDCIHAQYTVDRIKVRPINDTQTDIHTYIHIRIHTHMLIKIRPGHDIPWSEYDSSESVADQLTLIVAQDTFIPDLMPMYLRYQRSRYDSTRP